MREFGDVLGVILGIFGFCFILVGIIDKDMLFFIIGLILILVAIIIYPKYNYKLTYKFKFNDVLIVLIIKFEYDRNDILGYTKRKAINYDVLDIVRKAYYDSVIDDKEVDLIKLVDDVYRDVSEHLLKKKVVADVDKVIVKRKDQIVVRG